jgi:diaminopimelate decarboxylase
MEHFTLRDGEMWCEEVPLADIAAAVGTPVYVYSAAAMRRHASVLRSALGRLDDPLVAYAVKANPNRAVLKLLAAEGLGADVVSIGEYRRAIEAGIAPDKIVFAGVGKSADEMAEALGQGVLQFNLESIEEAATLSEVAVSLGRTAPVGFRINPDVAAETHAKITTGTAESKFGIPAGLTLDAYRAASTLPGLDVTGVAVHIGSQLMSLDPLEKAFRRLGELIAALRTEGANIRIADLGGGLGVSYAAAGPHPPTPSEYGAMVESVAGGWGVRLVFEPGRLIVANAGVLLARVVRLKSGATCPWLIVDAAMNDLMRPALYDAWHAIEAVRPTGKRMTAHVVGPVCESGDTFAMGREMDAMQAGDLMIFRTAGAYGAAMSSCYNSRPLTPEVLVEGGGWKLVRSRVDAADLAEATAEAARGMTAMSGNSQTSRIG